jgi:hypothetical protein
MIIIKVKKLISPHKKEAPTINLQLTNDLTFNSWWTVGGLMVDSRLTVGGLLVEAR